MASRSSAVALPPFILYAIDPFLRSDSLLLFWSKKKTWKTERAYKVCSVYGTGFGLRIGIYYEFVALLGNLACGYLHTFQ